MHTRFIEQRRVRLKNPVETMEMSSKLTCGHECIGSFINLSAIIWY